MFSNLCVYGRCVNIFGMFRCECDEGYALDGSGGEFMNGVEFLKCCTYSIQMYELVYLVLCSSDFHGILHVCIRAQADTHTYIHSQNTHTGTLAYVCVCAYTLSHLHIHRQIL
jgi:hypothetical protein